MTQNCELPRCLPEVEWINKYGISTQWTPHAGEHKGTATKPTHESPRSDAGSEKAGAEARVPCDSPYSKFRKKADSPRIEALGRDWMGT